MEINKTVNLNGQIKCENGKVIASLGAGINTTSMSLNISLNIIDKEKALANKESVIDGYKEFELKVKEMAEGLGYPII